MTREGYNKHKEVFEAWLDGKQIQILGENGQWIDSLADIKWKEHKEYRVKPTKIEFEDCSFNEVEYAINRWLEVESCYVEKYKSQYKKRFFKDKEIAEAYAVLPQLIRLRDEYNEGWKPDWGKDKSTKWVIYLSDNNINAGITSYAHYQLTFKTAEIRDKFFNDHRDLIEIAKPLL